MTSRRLDPHQLLTLAHRLVEQDGAPAQLRSVELRRAVSTAYYAVFHALTWTVTSELLGSQHHEQAAGASRWITHANVLDLATAVRFKVGAVSGRRNVPRGARHVAPILPSPVDERLVQLATAFVRLQEHRHRADYDERYEVSQATAVSHVRRADDALVALSELHRERDPGLMLLLRLALGAVHIAVDRAS